MNEVYCQIHNYVIKSHVSVTINNDAVKRASSLKTKPDFFYSNPIKYKNMNADTLKQVLDKIPGDYEVKYQDKRISDTFEIDVENREIILK